MIKKSLLLAFVAGALLAACDDSTSSNNPGGGGGGSPTQAVQAGQDTAINIVAGQTLKFTFVPKAGATYSITTTGKTDTYLEVRDKSDKTIKVDASPTSINGSIVLLTTSTDPVTILVSGGTASIAGGTILSIVMTNGPDDFEDDDRFGTARELKADSTLQAHTITENDTDWVKIPVVAGRRYTVSVPSYANTPYLQAFDKDSVAINSSSSYSIVFSAPATGYVHVRINYSYYSYTGAYSVRAWSDSVNIDKYEFDDTRATAKKVVIDSAAQTHRLASGESDWIKFDVIADSTYRITVKNSTNGTIEYDLYTSLTGSYTTYGSSSSGYTGTLNYTAKATGTVYVDLSGAYSSTTGTYTVQVDKIPNPNAPDAYEADNTLSTAKVIYADSTLQDHTIQARDVDWLKVSVAAGIRYRVSVPTSAYTAYLEAYSQDSTPLVSSTSGGISFALPTTGFVYVKISFASTSYTGAYSVRAWSDTLSTDKYEFDDTRATAKNIVVDSAAQSHKLAAGEHDWLKFPVVADSIYKITIANSANGMIDYRFYSSLAATSSSNSGSASSGTSTTITYAPAEDGTAYLDLSGYNTSITGAYTLSVSKAPNPNGPDAYESDNTLSTAKPIVVGAAAQSHTIRTADFDWIKIPVDSGKSYKIASTNSTYTLYMQVFQADSTALTSLNTSTMTFKATASGFVYVRLYYASTTYTGSYQIAVQSVANVVDDYEPDDTKATAKALPADGTVQSRYLQAGEKDWIKVDLVGGTTYTFTLTNAASALYSFEGDIQNATSTTALSYIDGYNALNTDTFTPSVSGTYYIDFHGYGSSDAGGYTLSVIAQ